MKHIFIINTHAGDGDFSDELRSVIAKENIEYYVFATGRKTKETEIVQRIARYFKGEKIRIYSCGGSGTFRNILNSIDNLEDVELAFFPCGLTNDFLKVFEEDEAYFHDIRNLIHGDVKLVDYIDTNHGRGINTLTIGMDADSVDGMDRYRPYGVLSGNIPYMLSIVYAILRAENVEYEVTIDGEVYRDSFFEVCFTNGCTLGGNLHIGIEKCANNGTANICVEYNRNIVTKIAILLDAIRGNVEHTRKYGGIVDKGYKTIQIRRTDGAPFAVNLDGELVRGFDAWDAKIVHEGLKFVIPKQVTKGIIKESL